MRDSRALWPRTLCLSCLGALLLSGCGVQLETEYGRSEGQSVNGTSVLAAALEAKGHEVEAAIRLNDDLAEWAGGMIRFAPYPGPPDRAEADWYESWLADDPDRWLIYVVGDFDARSEYWQSVVKDLDQKTDTEALDEARQSLAGAANWFGNLPAKSTTPADAASWFAVDRAFDPPRICTSLSGFWANGLDARGVALTLHEPLKANGETVLLAGDGKPFVIVKLLGRQNRVLVIANGSFLLNEALVNRARSGLVASLLDWIGPDPNRIALVEGSFVLGDTDGQLSLWQLLKRVPSLKWVAGQILVAAVLASLARAPRLGRPRDEPGSRPDRPAAHAEALGTLLARNEPRDQARAILDHYRSWRHPRTATENGPASRLSRSRGRRGIPVDKKVRDLAARAGGGSSQDLPKSPSQSDRAAKGRRTSDG